MIKKILFFCFALLLALGYFIFDAFLFKDKDANFSPPQCDLNARDCSYIFNGKEISISLQPKPLQAMQNLNLEIKNLAHYDDLELRVYGLNMFMGEIKPKLIAAQNGYRAEIFLPACVLDTMLYRAEFFQKGKALGFHFDFELRR